MNAIKTLAIASLVTFSMLAFTSCGGSTSTTEAATDTTVVVPTDMLQDETDNAAENMMQSQDSTATDSTKTGM